MATGSRSRNRAAQAERARVTRRRIVAAATTLFVRDGYLQTTMAGIAREAGVAVQTLYLSFGSKVAVLAAALDVAIAGDDEPVPVLLRPWRRQVLDEPDGPAALSHFIGAASQIIERHYPLYAAISSASADPELADLLERNKNARFETHGQLTRDLSGKAGFTRDLTVEQAAQIVYALLSQETYGLMVLEHGWSVGAWAGWVERHLRAELFPRL
jgi:AcrR family transcriptional regulator